MFENSAIVLHLR